MPGVRRTRIKLCGMMSAEDIALAVEAGADAVGVIIAPSSPRRVEIDALPLLAAAIPPFVTKIGVVTSPSENEAACLRALGFILQFSGEETPSECERRAAGGAYLKVFHLNGNAPGAAAALAIRAAGRTLSDERCFPIVNMRPQRGLQAEYDRFDEVESVEDYTNALPVFDSRVAGKLGGTGVTFAWDIVAPLARRRAIVVSGGLDPDNVAACVRQIRPYAVDVRSGIETNGRKDVRKMHAFVRAAKEGDEH